MGAVNLVFDRADGASLGLTYMTGAIVRAGEEVAARLGGRPSHGGHLYLLLWVALLGGAACGSLMVAWPAAALAGAAGAMASVGTLAIPAGAHRSGGLRP